MNTNSKNVNIALILTGGYGFPTGDAYTNRILAFAKGFVSNGCKISLLIVYPGRNNQADMKGTIDGFDYYFCTDLKWPDNYFKKKITGISGIITAIKILKKIHNTHPIDCIITFSQKFSQNFPLYLYTRSKNILFIRENNEFPRIILNRGHCNLSPIEHYYFSLVNRLYDGYIYISNALYNFNRDLIGHGMPVLIVPIIVDRERFTFSEESRDYKITYCGEMFSEKDGLNILLEAFSKIHEKIPEYKLTLIGDISDQASYKYLCSIIYAKGLHSKVEFTGFVHRNEIPRILYKSSVLVLARPNNIQAQGGFPTKLGEYLATGRPVLVTAVSDIPEYITDEINGYLAQPGSIDDFANKLEWILSNYNVAEKVGEIGKELTSTHFSNVYQSKRIIEFIDKLKN